MRRTFCWPLLCGLLILLSVAVWLAGVAGHVVPDRWMWHHDLWRTQPWTLWTAPLLHFLWPHLLGNALALAALTVLGTALKATPRDALALLLTWPLGTLALTLWPAVGGFYGLSGLVHAAAAIVAKPRPIMKRNDQNITGTFGTVFQAATTTWSGVAWRGSAT